MHLESLLELCSDECALLSPPLQGLRDEFRGECVELFVGLLHLVVLGVEYHALLYLLHVLLVEAILADGQLLYAEVCPQGISDGLPALLRDPAVEDFELH